MMPLTRLTARSALGAGVARWIDGYDLTTVTDDTHLTINLTKPNTLFLPSA